MFAVNQARFSPALFVGESCAETVLTLFMVFVFLVGNNIKAIECIGKTIKQSCGILFFVYVEHEFIKPDSVEYREYQVSIAKAATWKSTLVVLPTGLGKTVIALLVIAEKLKEKKGKILFLAPTKPLVLQHTSFLREHLVLDEEEIIFFTGEVSPKKRAELWEKSTIVVSTPQVVENDLISRRINLSDVSLVVFDEAHRAVGEYSYVFVAEQYQRQRDERLTLGITASPGSEVDRILEVCRNLGISNIEIRTKYDRDVRPYVHEMNIVWKRVEVPKEFAQVVQLLKKALSSRLKALKDAGVLESSSLSTINRRKLLDAQSRIQNALKESDGRNKVFFMLATVQNEALKIYHAIELLQTQGVNALRNYFQRLRSEAESKGGSRASKRVLNDPVVVEALAYLRNLSVEHPKIKYVVEILEDQFRVKPDSKVIVFTHYRDTALLVEKALEGRRHIKPVRFIGQASRGEEKGLSQRQQAEILEKFRAGVFNTLIATSVAEEGIDIPSTDMVVFYEPIPSEIRTIQRRGRTARQRSGKVVILIAKNTPDEGYYWSALRKEKRMRRELEYLRSEIERRVKRGGEGKVVQPVVLQQKRLMDFQTNVKENEGNGGVLVVVDHREYRSPVVKRLVEKGVRVEPRQLQVGDYVLSSRIGVERKSVDDFLESLVSGKLFRQMRELRDSYARPVLVIEGKNLFTRRNISQAAIFGCFVSIIVDYGIPIVATGDARETAEFLSVMAKREQRDEKKEVALRGEKKGMSVHERQQFIVEGLSNISAVLAKRLLQHFKTIQNIANASEEELFQVPGIGRVTAKEIFEIFRKPYLEK